MSDEARPWAGVIDLRDLHAYRWSPRYLPAILEALGVAPGPRCVQSFLPPDRLVVIAPALLPDPLRHSLAWLSSAASLLLVRDFEGTDLAAEEPELFEHLELEWRELADSLGNVEALFDLHPGPAGALAVALDRALDLGPALSRRPLPPRPPGRSEWPSGPWVLLAKEIEPTDLAPLLCVPPSGPALGLEDRLISLTEGPDALPPLQLSASSAASSDGRLRLTRSGALVTPEGEVVYANQTRFGLPVGFDPTHPLATSGFRCTFTWHFVTERARAELCTSSHDWPCGHAKKLWGYKDNQPVVVAVAPDASAYVSTFEHDALVSSDVPMRWRLAGDLAVADWPPDPAADPLRALLFCTGEIPWPQGDPLDAQDDDQRAFAPAVVLGPDAICGYAVDLNHPTYRIRGERSERIDDGTGGYAIFDARHALVRRGEGRLLAGWFGVATILHEGQLFREDLATGARRSQLAARVLEQKRTWRRLRRRTLHGNQDQQSGERPKCTHGIPPARSRSHCTVGVAGHSKPRRPSPTVSRVRRPAPVGERAARACWARAPDRRCEACPGDGSTPIRPWPRQNVSRTPALKARPSSGAQTSVIQRPSGERTGSTSGS